MDMVGTTWCCWAFSTLASTRGGGGGNELTTGKLISLSEQELCGLRDTKGDDQGCNGGIMEHYAPSPQVKAVVGFNCH